MPQLGHENHEVCLSICLYSRYAHATREDAAEFAIGAGRKWYAKYYDSSVAIPSPEFDVLRAAASANTVLLSAGIIEKDGATLYCTSVLIGEDGTLLSKHRKVREG